MMNKFGVNNTRMEKKVAGERGPVKKIVTCSKCGRRFEKSCPNEQLCKISNRRCPHCGGEMEA
jgi:DNA-directed RNA polymerase subunit RPC12/RpoP